MYFTLLQTAVCGVKQRRTVSDRAIGELSVWAIALCTDPNLSEGASIYEFFYLCLPYLMLRSPPPNTLMQTSFSTVSPSEPSPSAIPGVTETVIWQYFETLNAGAFDATSQLFAVDGVMQPPFEQPVAGRDAIAAYLQAEANGLQLQPRQGITRSLEDSCTEVQVSGKVQTPIFAVNVSWLFRLNANQELLLAKIKLLASPQELLKLRH